MINISFLNTDNVKKFLQNKRNLAIILIAIPVIVLIFYFIFNDDGFSNFMPVPVRDDYDDFDIYSEVDLLKQEQENLLRANIYS